jgi:hypothetical protein
MAEAEFLSLYRRLVNDLSEAKGASDRGDDSRLDKMYELLIHETPAVHASSSAKKYERVHQTLRMMIPEGAFRPQTPLMMVDTLRKYVARLNGGESSM